jgi:GLPGLI family protein
MNFQVKYHLDYIPDSTNKNIKSATFTLSIKNNEFSTFASNSYLKADSISALLKKGILTDNDIISNPQNRFLTRFNQFINKSYTTNKSKIYETIGGFPYVYSIENTLKWVISTEQSKILGYNCTKATTQYSGRNYEAWFTSEIPISDGPHIFRGLPGLIIKLNDVRNHYVFTAISLNKIEKEVAEAPIFRKQQPIATNRDKVFLMREEFTKDPYGYLTRMTGHSFDKVIMTSNGETTSIKSTSLHNNDNNNPLELKQ